MKILESFLNSRISLIIPTKPYLKVVFRHKMHYKLNLKRPKNFNEWIQWTKVYYKNPKYPILMDKIAVKKVVAKKIGKEYLIPSIGTYSNFDEINFNKLPNQFVIKCNHDSKSTVVCKDKSTFDIDNAKKIINKHLKTPFWIHAREWGYKQIKPAIIIEKYITDKTGNLPNDYKFYCFNGHADYVMVCTERESKNPKFYYLDKNWNLMSEFSKDGKKDKKNFNLPKPKNLSKMFDIAEKLAKELPFVRLDLYSVNNKIYFGEYTTYPTAGFDSSRTEKAEKYLSENFQKLNLKPRR